MTPYLFLKHTARALFVICTFISTTPLTAKEDEPKIKVFKPWLRAESGLSYMRRNRDMSMIAFVPVGENGLRIIETKSGNIYSATQESTGGSFFWSPDNARLFFRELSMKDGKATTVVRAWDAALKKTVHVESINGSSGLLSFDPRDQRMMLMHSKGIMTKRLVFPDERLAHWQTAQRTDRGKWVAAAGGMTFVTQQGFAMSKLEDDSTGIESFDISPTAELAVWATKSGKIYVSRQGEKAKFVDYGRDPQWHPTREMIVYAGGRMVGNKAAQYDIKIAESAGPGSFLTTTQNHSERWPFWSPDGNTIIFTLNGTTDVLTMKNPTPEVQQ